MGVIPATLSRVDASELVQRHRNIQWLALLKAEARGRNMPTLARHLEAELGIQRTMFWTIADRAGFLMVTRTEIEEAARLAFIAAEA